MAKKQDLAAGIDEQEQAFQMIELAISDLDLLTRAFETITEVCESQDAPLIAFPDNVTEKIILN